MIMGKPGVRFPSLPRKWRWPISGIRAKPGVRYPAENLKVAFGLMVLSVRDGSIVTSYTLQRGRRGLAGVE